MGIFFAAPIDQHPDYNKVTTTPTGGSANAAYPIGNLLTYDPTQPYVATAQAPANIVWDFGVQRSFNVVALIYTNLVEASVWTLAGSNDNITYTVFKASGAALAHIVSGQTTQNLQNMLRKNHALWHSDTLQTWRYLRITINSSTTGLLPSVGRLFVGTKFVPSTGWQYGSGFDFQDLSPRERTDRGALVMDPIPVIPMASVKMDFLNKQEMMDFIWEFNYWRGSAREMLACLDTDTIQYLQKNIFYCTISEGRRISFDSYNTHSVNWILESIGAA